MIGQLNLIETCYRALDFFYSRRKLLFAILLIFFIAVGMSVFYRGALGEKVRTDLSVFVRAAEAVVEGQNIYDVKTPRQWNYVYLPLLAILMVPFTYIPFPVTVLAWYGISVAALVAGCRMGMKLSEDAKQGWLACLLAAFLTLPAILNTLTRGQLGILTVFFLLLPFFLYDRKHPWLAGLALSFGIVLKVSPAAPVVFFFLFRRQWKILFSFAGGICLFLFLLPSAAVGIERNLFFLQGYFRLMTEAVSAGAQNSILWQQLLTPFAEDNQSLHAVIVRYTWQDASALAAGSASGLRTGMRILGLVAIFLLGWIKTSDEPFLERKRALLEYSLYPVVMLLVSPVSQIHHYVALYPVFLAAALYLFELPLKTVPYKAIEAGIWIAALSYLAGLIFAPLSYWGIPAWGTTLFWIVLYGVLVRKESLTS